MTISNDQKKSIKNKIKSELEKESEIQKIVVFGSFINSNNPKDIDIAVFQDSNETYLPLALKYRRLTRDISKILPIDIIPLKIGKTGVFLEELENCEIIYER